MIVMIWSRGILTNGINSAKTLNLLITVRERFHIMTTDWHLHVSLGSMAAASYFKMYK